MAMRKVPTKADLQAQTVVGSLESCKANVPDDKSYRIFKVTATKDVTIGEGATFYLQHAGPLNAHRSFCRQLGILVEQAEPGRKPPQLLTTQELRELLAQREAAEREAEAAEAPAESAGGDVIRDVDVVPMTKGRK